MPLIILGIVFVLIAVWLTARNYRRDTGDVVDKTKTLSSRTTTDAGWLPAKLEAVASKARTELNENLVKESKTQIELSQIPAEIRIAELTDQQKILTQEAATHNAPDLAHATEKVKLAVQNNALVVTEAATEMQLDNFSYTEVRKATELDKVRLETRWREKEQDLRAAFTFQQAEYQKLYLLLDYIKGLYRASQSEKDERQKELTEEHIRFMESHFRERQRLLQVNAQAHLPGGDEDTDGGRDYREAMDESSD